MVCLDSDVIINFLRNDRDVVKKILELHEKEELTTTSINAFEILRGLSKFDKTEKGYEFISNLRILDFNFEASKKAAEISNNLRKEGKDIDAIDMFIASIAIINKEPFLTGNIDHFRRISQLKIEKV